MKAISSGLQEVSNVIFAHPCWYLGGTLVTDLINKDVKLIIFNSTAAPSDDEGEIDYFQATDEKPNEFHSLVEPVWCSEGIYARMDATEGDYIIWYAL